MRNRTSDKEKNPDASIRPQTGWKSGVDTPLWIRSWKPVLVAALAVLLLCCRSFGVEETLKVVRIGYQKYGSFNVVKARHTLDDQLAKREIKIDWILLPAVRALESAGLKYSDIYPVYLPPGDPVASDRRFHRSRNYISDPWSSSTLRRLAYAGDILILGSGLTALDLIVSLSQIKRSGRIYLLSRRGHFPHRHAPVEPYAFHQFDPRKIGSVRHLLRVVRNEVSLAASMNIGWRPVIDALRPHTQAIWQQLDLVERRRFLRHLRPYWECHRHRAAPEVLDVKDAMEKAGRLRCYQGRLESILENENTLLVKFRNRSGAPYELAAASIRPGQAHS